MNNEEAKRLYKEAILCFKGKDYAGALALLEELDRDRPNSRHVHYYLALCHVELGNAEKARESYQKLEGRIDETALARLAEAIEVSRTPRRKWDLNPVISSSDSLAEKDIIVVQDDTDMIGQAVFQVSTAHPLSTDECSVTGAVQRGVFHTGDVAAVISPAGDHIQVPVLRIGPADMPLNLAREGLRTSLLLRVDPVLIGPGASLLFEPATASPIQPVPGESRRRATSSTIERTSRLNSIERLIKQGEYREAESLLQAYVEEHPQSVGARRLLAKVYMDEHSPLRDANQALEWARSAYEGGGDDDPVAIDTLAQALAENGDAEQGLLLLERLHEQTEDMEARHAVAERIHAFRARNNLGEVWEFRDDYEEVILETRGPGEIMKAITNGILTTETLCRRDHVGDWQPLSISVGNAYPQIGALIQPQEMQNNTRFIVVLVLLGIAILMGLFLPQIASLLP